MLKKNIFQKTYQWVKWLIITIFLISVVITAITLLFDDYDLTLNEDLGNRRAPESHVRDAPLDLIVDEILAKHPNQTGLALLDNNLEAFAIRAVTARTAVRTLDLQYYIWNTDLTGRLLGYELVKAADRGVYIRLLLDDLNSMDRDSMLTALSEHPNIDIRLFNPVYTRQNFITRRVEFLFRGLSLNRRMHNKAWIIDGNLSIIGGRNIGDEYFDASPNTNFFDVDVILAGEGVKETEVIFEQFWTSAAVRPFSNLHSRKNLTLDQIRYEAENLTEHRQQLVDLYVDQITDSPSIKEILQNGKEFYWTDNAHVYSDPPEKVFDQNEDKWLLNYINSSWEKAKEELYLVSPYFVPGKEGIKNLTRIKERGVNIKVLTNSLAATDVLMVHSGYAPYRKPLLKAGVELFELLPYSFTKKTGIGVKGKSLHTKIYMIDDRYSFIGSYNLDPRSARLNTEMGILFDEPNITKALKDLYAVRIGPNNSYKLHLVENKIKWEDQSDEDRKIWSHEPETNIFVRAVSKVISWLPIESQL